MPELVTTLSIVAAVLVILVPIAAGIAATTSPQSGPRRPLSRRIEQATIRILLAVLTHLERAIARRS